MMLHWTPSTAAPSASSSATVRAIFSAFQSATTTVAPALAKWCAIPRPTPWPDPVTITTRPSTECIARISAAGRAAQAPLAAVGSRSTPGIAHARTLRRAQAPMSSTMTPSGSRTTAIGTIVSCMPATSIRRASPPRPSAASRASVSSTST